MAVLTSDNEIKAVLELHEERSGRLRRCSISGSLREVIQVWRESENPWFEQNNNYVFPGYKGSHLSPQHLDQLIADWTQAAGVTGVFATHTLRKTFGYFHFQQCSDLALLARILGQSSQKVTRRYIGLPANAELDEANLRLHL